MMELLSERSCGGSRWILKVVFGGIEEGGMWRVDICGEGGVEVDNEGSVEEGGM